jgi:hypothetical protein
MIEKDDLSAAIGTKEHSGRCRGKGAVPWKLAWREKIDTHIKVTTGLRTNSNDN